MTTPRALGALFWDVDGTMAETERDGHRVAFNLAFAELGLPRRWDDAQYGELLRVAGGRERLLHDMGHWPDAPLSMSERDALARTLHARKNVHYLQLLADPGIALRDGVLDLMRECREHGLPMAVVTTTGRANLAGLLRRPLGERWNDWFTATICAEDVRRKKPDPEVIHIALAAVGVHAGNVVVIEDSPAGVAAARAANCAVLVTRSSYFAVAQIDGAMAIGPGLQTRTGWCPALPERAEAQRVSLADIDGWLADSGDSDHRQGLRCIFEE